MKSHTTLYSAAQLLQRERGDFTAGDLIERVYREFDDKSPGVRTHTSSHYVADTASSAATMHNYLRRIERNWYRCFDPETDSPHPTRTDKRVKPDEEDVRTEYRWLLQERT